MSYGWLDSRSSGYQGLVGVGGHRLAADPVTGQAAVVVAAARGHQAEIVGQGEEPGSFGSWLVGMEDLHPGQTRGGQPADLLVGDYPVAPRPRVSQHRDAAGVADQADRVDRIERVPADVGPAAVADPVTGERLAGRGDGAAARHRAGYMRAADHGRAGDGRHLVPGDVDAEVR